MLEYGGVMGRILGVEVENILITIIDIPKGDQLRRNISPSIIHQPNINYTRTPVSEMAADNGLL